MKRLEINQKRDGALDFDLAKIITFLPIEGQLWEWRLKELNAVGEGAVKLESELDESTDDGGIAFNSSQLQKAFEDVDQVIDMRLLGTETADRKDGSQPCLIFIEVKDSTTWSIETNVASVLAWIATSYPDAV